MRLTMVKRVILWKLKEEIEDKAAVKSGIKAGLESLKGVIPGLVSGRARSSNAPLTTNR